ncbi:hypothetical protein B296_00041245 [Ensete ventricosum]|uniref:Uncharacterized protein n=1 Tax=Ensete ventricosum TaxID=4639 RepID=A0A426Y2W1_ENSVE|nr:hypothetical protein B296_00041245 [Ensete ventricosum]
MKRRRKVRLEGNNGGGKGTEDGTKMRVAVGVQRDSTVNVEREQGRRKRAAVRFDEHCGVVGHPWSAAAGNNGDDAAREPDAGVLVAVVGNDVDNQR